MKKLAMLAVLTGTVWAAGVTQVSAFSQCGIGCPGGYHPESYHCDTSCGLCINACYQASNCQPNDDSFRTCGSCPPGYRTTSQYCNTRCIVCGASCFGQNNASSCSKI